MITLLICSDYYHNELEMLMSKYPKVHFIETDCSELDESQPVIFRVPDGKFYRHVTRERLLDVISGNANDLLIQTARLFSVEMKRFISEPKYRRIVKEIKELLLTLPEYNSKSISNLVKEFASDNEYDLIDIVNPMKIAIIGTTKGPKLPEVMEAIGKNEVLLRIDKYLRNYRYRI